MPAAAFLLHPLSPHSLATHLLPPTHNLKAPPAQVAAKKEAIAAAEDLLASKGYIIIPTEDQNEIEGSVPEVEVVSNNTIAKDSYEQVKEEKDEEVEIAPENTKEERIEEEDELEQGGTTEPILDEDGF